MKLPLKLTTTRITVNDRITVPSVYKHVFGLREGDLLVWSLAPETGQIQLTPQRAQLLTPRVVSMMKERRSSFIEQSAAAGMTEMTQH